MDREKWYPELYLHKKNDLLYITADISQDFFQNVL
jgi:hypothetical protein